MSVLKNAYEWLFGAHTYRIQYRNRCENNKKFDFDKSMILRLRNYTRLWGFYCNQPCGWTNEQLFAWIDAMHLYEPATMRIPRRKFYWVSADMPDYDDPTTVFSSGWASFLGHTIPTAELISWMACLLRGKTTLSFGAGLGLHEYMLQNAGCRILPMDRVIEPFTYTHIILTSDLTDSTTNPLPQLRSERIILRNSDIDVLMLLWAEPDSDCTCHDASQWCNTGYDARVLKHLAPPYVLIIAEDFCTPNKESPNSVLSDDARALLASDYCRVAWHRVPTCCEKNYRPYAAFYERKKEAQRT